MKHFGTPAYIDMDESVLRFGSKLEADQFCSQQSLNLGCTLIRLNEEATKDYHFKASATL